MRSSLVVVLVVAALSLDAFAASKKAEKTARIEDGVAKIDQKLGELVIDKVEVKRLPTPEKLAEMLAKNPKDTCSPRVTVDYANPGDVRLKVDFALDLLDEKGAVLLSCKKDATVDPRVKSDYKVVCPLANGLLCADTPRLHSVRLAASADSASLTLDKTFPFSKNLAEVNEKLGDIVIDKVFAANAPSAESIEKAKSNPTSSCHPWVNLLISNPTDDKVKVEMRVVLLDASGTAIATCDNTATIKAKKRSEDYTVCQPEIPTADWPKITKAKVTVAIKDGWF